MRRDIRLPNRATRPEFSPEQWVKIEASIRPPGLRASSKNRRTPPKVLPEELKQEICDALLMHNLMSTINYHPEAQERRALEGLVELTRSYSLQLSKLKKDVGVIIDQIKGLIEQTETVHELACFELKMRPKPKRGRPRQINRRPKPKRRRPRQINRKGLVHSLLGIYTRWTGWPIGLSKSVDPQTKRRKPSGPCYRFVTTILQTSNIPIKGVEHIIADAAAHTKNLSPKDKPL